MALSDAIPVRFEDVFEAAFVAGDVEPVRDWKASTAENFVQATVEVLDPGTGEQRPVRLWRATLQDGEGEQFQLRLVADVQPVLPAPVLAGLRPVELVGLMVEPMINRDRCKAPWGGRQHRCSARVEIMYWATGVVEPAQVQGEAA